VRPGNLARISLRYTLSFGRGHLSVFMAGVSMTGLVLATALLLTVLSVMNGFEREMRDRILALVPHVTVHTPGDGGRPYGIEARLAALPGIEAWEPFVSFDAMAVRGARAAPVSVLGLAAPPPGLRSISNADPESGLILGDAVAERLGAAPGDGVTLLVPGSGGFRSGAIDAQRRRVTEVVDTGTEIDEALVFASLEDAGELSGLGAGISGWRLRFSDPFAVDRLIPELRRTLPPGSYATTWRMTHGNLYAAIQLSRDLVVLLLTSIIGVAAFNVVSALVLIVIDQRGSIAILRTLGATPASMAALFVFQGGLIGVLGSVLGCVLGWLLCRALPGIVGTLERALGFRFLNTDVYPVSFIPVDLRWDDALLIALVSVFMCILAALYPALQAARLAPAAVLQGERA
jgi:lipoprotein-releasing system permease protein